MVLQCPSCNQVRSANGGKKTSLVAARSASSQSMWTRAWITLNRVRSALPSKASGVMRRASPEHAHSTATVSLTHFIDSVADADF